MRLRRIRLGVSIVVGLLFVVVFLGSVEWSLSLSGGLLYFQFVPSVVEFLLAAGGVASLGFLLVLVLTLIFGRIYCSGLCPLGILQDILIFLFKKVGGKRVQHKYRKPRPWIRYSVLLATLLLAMPGSLVLLNLLDPYSLFGRIASHLVKPPVYLFNNLVVSALESFDIYRLRPQEIPPVPLSVLGVSLLFFVGLLLLSLFYGRMYCNLICPVGTLLGLISRFSLFGFAIDADKCKACDRCAKSCKAGCIDGGKDGGGQSDGPDLDPTRCVACFNCLEACRKSAIRYGIVFEERKNAPMDRSKRKLMVGTASMGAALAVSSLPARSYGKRLIPDHNGHPAAPPGSSSVSHFNETCTACHLCIHVCQTQVLNPALFEYGLKGILQPVMDFDRGKCAYECKACGDVCPSGAISPLALDVKKLTKIGSVKLLKEICITHKEDRDCGACAEVCPTHAVYTEIRNNVRYPEITPDPCTGCGACQFVCPTQPDKAILVEGDVVHSIAQKPFQDEKGRVEKPPPDTEEKFPF